MKLRRLLARYPLEGNSHFIAILNKKISFVDTQEKVPLQNRLSSLVVHRVGFFLGTRTLLTRQAAA